MAIEIQRRIDFATRTVTVDVQDIFGVITPHTIPMTGDHCPTCGCSLPGTTGSPDLEASVAAAIAHVGEIEQGFLAQLKSSPNLSPDIAQAIQTAETTLAAHATAITATGAAPNAR
jgi:hypothetical protein